MSAMYLISPSSPALRAIVPHGSHDGPPKRVQASRIVAGQRGGHSRRNAPPDEVVFDEVIDTDGTIWPAFTDDRGVLWIDVDYDVEVVIDRAIVDGKIRDAEVDEHGRIWIDYD